MASNNVEYSSPRPLMVWILILLQAFLALGGIITGILLMARPDGSILQMPLSVMKGAPFHNFFIPGMILFIFLGIYPMGIAYGLLNKPAWSWPDTVNPFRKIHWSWTGSLVVGVIVIIWLVTELVWVEYSFLHTVYFLWSSLIILISLLPGVRRYLRKFS